MRRDYVVHNVSRRATSQSGLYTRGSGISLKSHPRGALVAYPLPPQGLGHSSWPGSEVSASPCVHPTSFSLFSFLPFFFFCGTRD
jgi:hypothetical protein